MKLIFKWGIALGIAVSLGTQILTWLGLGLTNWFLILTYVLLVFVLIFALKEISKIHAGNFKIMNGFLLIVGIIIISRLVFQIYMFIHTRYIDVEWIDSVAEAWEVALTSSNVATVQIENQVQNFRKSYETVPMFTSALLSYAIPQFIIGLIITVVYYFVGNRKK